jgi:predicted RNase H-like HicB family nuclease
MNLPDKIKSLIPMYSYDVIFSKEDNVYVVSVKEIRGCSTHGRSIEEAMALAYEAVEGHLITLQSIGSKIPFPLKQLI